MVTWGRSPFWHIWFFKKVPQPPGQFMSFWLPVRRALPSFMSRISAWNLFFDLSKKNGGRWSVMGKKNSRSLGFLGVSYFFPWLGSWRWQMSSIDCQVSYICRWSPNTGSTIGKPRFKPNCQHGVAPLTSGSKQTSLPSVGSNKFRDHVISRLNDKKSKNVT